MSMTPINLEEILVVNIAGALMLLVLPFLRMQTRESKHVDDHLFNWRLRWARWSWRRSPSSSTEGPAP